MKDEKWNPTNDALPKRGQKVDWIAPSGEVVRGGTYDVIWMLPGGEMYVYYTPPFWRPAEQYK